MKQVITGGESPRERAQREAHDIGIDRMVRSIARQGKFDGTANYWDARSSPQGMVEVRATFGAGTNSASVLLSGQYVYYCSEYGGYLTTFRRGPWLDVVREWAVEAEDSEAAERVIREVTKKAQEDERFSPLEDA